MTDLRTRALALLAGMGDTAAEIARKLDAGLALSPIEGAMLDAVAGGDGYLLAGERLDPLKVGLQRDGAWWRHVTYDGRPVDGSAVTRYTYAHDAIEVHRAPAVVVRTSEWACDRCGTAGQVTTDSREPPGIVEHEFARAHRRGAPACTGTPRQTAVHLDDRLEAA